MPKIIAKKTYYVIKGRNKTSGIRDILSGPYKSKNQAAEAIIQECLKHGSTHSYITVCKW